jgi:hypothetical protein
MTEHRLWAWQSPRRTAPMQSSFSRTAVSSGMRLAVAHPLRSVAAPSGRARLQAAWSCTIGCPVFPCNCSTGSTTPPASDDRAPPQDFKKIQRQPRHSLNCAARGRVGRTRAANGHLPSENGQLTRTQTHASRPPPFRQRDFNRPRRHRKHRLATSRGGSVDRPRPLKEAHNTRACHGTTLRFGHNQVSSFRL